MCGCAVGRGRQRVLGERDGIEARAAWCRPCPRPSAAPAGCRSPDAGSGGRTRRSWRRRAPPRAARTRSPRTGAPGRSRRTAPRARGRTGSPRSSPGCPGRRTRRGSGCRRRPPGAPRRPSWTSCSASTHRELHAGLVRDAAVGERLGQALVGVPQVDVLADHRDRAPSARRFLIFRTMPPSGTGRWARSGSPSSFTMMSSSPSWWKTSGTS